MTDMCKGKVRYRGKYAALNAAVRLARLAPHRAYPCPKCHGWHCTVKRAFQ